MKPRLDAIAIGFAIVALLFIAVQIVPIGWGLVLGFTRSGPFSPAPVFVGLENFALIFADHVFWSALAKGGVYALLTVTLQVVVGVGVAVLLFKHAGPLARSLTLLPYMIPAVT